MSFMTVTPPSALMGSTLLRKGASYALCRGVYTSVHPPPDDSTADSVNSSFLAVNLKGRRVYLKRDDLLFTHGVNGNKARKFHSFGSLVPFPQHVYSIGGVQSNSMLAIAKIVAQHAGSHFYYFTKPIPKFLKNKPTGNYATALSLGMKVVEATGDEYRQLMSMQNNALSTAHEPLVDQLVRAATSASAATFTTTPATTFDAATTTTFTTTSTTTARRGHFWIPQGGAMAEARQGVDQLGAEISQFLNSKPLDSSGQRRCQVFVESGTGTTALFLHRYFQRKRRKQRQRQSQQQREGEPGHIGGVFDNKACVHESHCKSSGMINGLQDENGATRWHVSVIAVSCVMPPADLTRHMETMLLRFSSSSNPQPDLSSLGDDMKIDEGGEGDDDDDEDEDDDLAKNIPDVLSQPSHSNTPSNKFIPFGTPLAAHLEIWKYLIAQTGVLFDLLYAPKSFEQIFRHWEEENQNFQNDICNESKSDIKNLIHNSGCIDFSNYENEGNQGPVTSSSSVNDNPPPLIVYVHCGGSEGNISQLNRYRYCKLIS